MIAEADEIKIKLSFIEWIVAMVVGMVRHGLAVMERRKPTWKEGREGWSHIFGAPAEAAWFKWKGMWWEPVMRSIGGPDAPHLIQIRATNMKYPYYKVHENESPNQIVVFVRSDEMDHRLVGWLPMKWAQAIGAKEDPGQRGYPCLHIFPQHLLPMRFLLTDVRSTCPKHGVIPGDAECPLCVLEEQAAPAENGRR